VADDVTFRAQYLSKLEADLKSIDLERDRVRTQIEALERELAELDHDHDALVNMRQALAEQHGVDSSVPAGQAPGEDGEGALQSGDSRLTLRDLIHDYLGSLRQPAAVSEVTEAMARLYPQRRVQVPVVRNTLEGLVAKGLAVRSKQDRLVFYRAAAPAD
jgi:hypothetical protein